MQKSQDCVELQNPTYLLVLDFRSLEEWLEERLVTSLHHERLQYLERYKGQDNDHLHYNKNEGWSSGRCNPAGLARYNSVLLYDRDGASVGNLRCLSTEKL